MKNIRPSLLGASAVCALLPMLSGAAHAQNNIQFTNDNGSTGVKVNYTFNGNKYSESTAAGVYHFNVGGKSYQGYCTDLVNNIYNNESWHATFASIDDPTYGLSSTWYEKIVGLTSSNLNAIDYIAANYIGSSQSAAAQVAVWDLSLNSHVSKSGSNYNYSNTFNSSLSAQSVYNVEQAALSHDGSSWGSVLANAGPKSSGRPQDIVFGSNNTPFSPPPPAAPEASSAAGMSTLFGIGALGMLKRKRRNR